MRRLWLCLGLVGCTPALTDPPAPRTVRIVTFGDSNTDRGAQGRTLTDGGYVSPDATLRHPADAPNSPTQLAGMIEALSDPGGVSFVAVNHGESGTTTGANVNPYGGTNALQSEAGVTRYEAEVLGRGAPWTGPDGLVRVQAYAPSVHDFVVIAIGTNDWLDGMPPDSTLAHLARMADEWRGAGLPASHCILTTLPPAMLQGYAETIPRLNVGIRALARAKGLGFVDLVRLVSDDNGATWRDDSLHVGDGVHYAEGVKRALARAVAEVARH